MQSFTHPTNFQDVFQRESLIDDHLQTGHFGYILDRLDDGMPIGRRYVRYQSTAVAQHDDETQQSPGSLYETNRPPHIMANETWRSKHEIIISFRNSDLIGHGVDIPLSTSAAVTY